LDAEGGCGLNVEINGLFILVFLASKERKDTRGALKLFLSLYEWRLVIGMSEKAETAGIVPSA
jgi:hypothetical protein